MKQLNNFINEARQLRYNVAFNDCVDKDELPISATILIEYEDKEAFEKFLKDEEGNTFAHADGGNIEY